MFLPDLYELPLLHFIAIALGASAIVVWGLWCRFRILHVLSLVMASLFVIAGAQVYFSPGFAGMILHEMGYGYLCAQVTSYLLPMIAFGAVLAWRVGRWRIDRSAEGRAPHPAVDAI